MTVIENGPLSGYSQQEILRVIAECDDPDDLEAIIAALEAELAWTPWPYQEAPVGEWAVWLFLAGRFAGKTDTMAYEMDEHAKGPACDPRLPGGHRMSIVAPTLGDAAGACFYGPSGLRAHNPEVELTGSLEKIVRWPNGAEARLFGGNSAGDVERFRAGGNRCFCWVEEGAAIPQLDAVWEQIPFSHRLGPNPRVIMSTTPKPRALLKRLVAYGRDWQAHPERRPSRWQRVALTRASSRDNPAIDPDVVAGIYDLYGGSRIGRQELEGELLDDYDGALWRRHDDAGSGLDDLRIDPLDLPTLVRKNVGVDPSTWGLKLGDRQPDAGEIARGIETGIVAGGIAADRQVYTFTDESKRCGPSEWADIVLDVFWGLRHPNPERWRCNDIVFETNAGGAMGPAIIRAQEKLRRVDHPNLDLAPVRFYSRNAGKIIGVQAADGKRARAEPVATLADTRRHHMVGVLPLLEDQLCGWDPNEAWSPDRLDGMVWHVTALDPWRRASRSGMGVRPRGDVTR